MKCIDPLLGDITWLFLPASLWKTVVMLCVLLGALMLVACLGYMRGRYDVAQQLKRLRGPLEI